jgi:hypothetical protein
MSWDQLPNDDLSFKPFKSYIICNIEYDLLLVDQKCIFQKSSIHSLALCWLLAGSLALLLRTPDLDKRMDKNLINLQKSLKEPGVVPSKSALDLGSKLFESLFSWDLPCDDKNIEKHENEKVGQEPLSMADKLSTLKK